LEKLSTKLFKNVAVVLHNIATIYLEIGDDDEALRHYLETLRVEQASLGHNHKDVTATMMHIGHIYQQRGELDQALKYFGDCLEIQKSVSNPDPGDIAQTLNHIGNIHLQRGDADKLLVSFSEAVRYFRLSGKDEKELEILAIQLAGVRMTTRCETRKSTTVALQCLPPSE